MSRISLLFPLLVLGATMYIACKRSPVPVMQDNTEVIITPAGDTIYIVNTDTIYISNGAATHPCSPDTVYFEQQLLPILLSNCASPTCHDNTTHKENIWITDYEHILTTGGVKLNSPTTSKLYTSTSPTAGERMPPPPRAALTADQRALILKWIQQGAQDLHCDAACDTTVFTYNIAVKPIINQRCLGCHSGSSASGNTVYDTYAGVKASVDSGKFWKSITHASGVKPMPYPLGSSKLSNCEMSKIKQWIDAGALDN